MGRAEIHYLQGIPLELTAADRGLTIAGYGGTLGPMPILSGARQLSLTWVPHDTSGGLNVWKAVVREDIPEIGGLRVNGKRQVRARWPNGDPETMVVPSIRAPPSP